MSRLITTICIVSFILLISISSIWYARETDKAFTLLIDEAIESCNNKDNEKLFENIDRLSALWKSRQPILSLYVRHNEMDSVDTLLVIIEGYGETESYTSAIVELHQLKCIINHIYIKQLPTIDNLF